MCTVLPLCPIGQQQLGVGRAAGFCPRAGIPEDIYQSVAPKVGERPCSSGLPAYRQLHWLPFPRPIETSADIKAPTRIVRDALIHANENWTRPLSEDELAARFEAAWCCVHGYASLWVEGSRKSRSHDGGTTNAPRVAAITCVRVGPPFLKRSGGSDVRSAVLELCLLGIFEECVIANAHIEIRSVTKSRLPEIDPDPYRVTG